MGRSLRTDVPAGRRCATQRLSSPDELSLCPEGPRRLGGARCCRPSCCAGAGARRAAARSSGAWWRPSRSPRLTVILDPLAQPDRRRPVPVAGDPRASSALACSARRSSRAARAAAEAWGARAASCGHRNALPGLRWFVTVYAEEELTAAVVPFIADEQVTPAGCWPRVAACRGPPRSRAARRRGIGAAASTACSRWEAWSRSPVSSRPAPTWPSSAGSPRDSWPFASRRGGMTSRPCYRTPPAVAAHHRVRARRRAVDQQPDRDDLSRPARNAHPPGGRYDPRSAAAGGPAQATGALTLPVRMHRRHGRG